MSNTKKNNSANNTSASDNTRAASEGAGEQDLKAMLGVDGEEDKAVKAIYTGSVDVDTLPEKEEHHKKPSGAPDLASFGNTSGSGLDALDRDLEAARQNKLKEELELKRKREEELKKEEERLERARVSMERRAEMEKKARERAEQQRRENARNREDEGSKGGAIMRETEGGAVSHGTAPVKKDATDKAHNAQVLSIGALKGLITAAVIVIVAYVGGFIWARQSNEKVYEDLSTRLTNLNRLVSDESIPYDVPEGAPLSLETKSTGNLSVGLADSDKDGITDEAEKDYGTEADRPDSDGDGVEDGAEIMSGLDPTKGSTDGTTPDAQIISDASYAAGTAELTLTDHPGTSPVVFEESDNNSIKGSPGVVNTAYEFYCDKYSSATLTIGYSEEDLTSRGYTDSDLAIYRFNADTLSFEPLETSVDKAQRLASAQLDRSGIYALCDSAVLSEEGRIRVFFLIDNSGSMYPEELCAGSEENDVEFKRLDFAMNLIDMIGDNASYAAGEFSGSYKLICGFSDNGEQVKSKIDDIRNRSNPTFSGTEIAAAVEGAIKEFGNINISDRNYIILLTDGMPTTMNTDRDRKVISEARADNITIFTIGLGKDINTEYLNTISGETNGQFFQASNADALENIYEKIDSFMSYNRVVIDEQSGKTGFLVADSGFNIRRDGLGYLNFRADFAPDGADVGIAGVMRAYYKGELVQKAEGYTTKDGRSIPGYDISGIADFTDGKADLSDVKVDILTKYNAYLQFADKWDYRKISGGLLRYNDSTRDFIEKAGLRVITSDYAYDAPKESMFAGFVKLITFSQIKSFDKYECVLIDRSMCSGEDKAILDMINWYCYRPYAEDAVIYDFGYEGDKAFEALVQELSNSSPAVIAYGGNALNAVRIARDAEDPDIFVLEAYDSNSPEQSVHITLERTPLYTGNGSKYQYAASRNGIEQPLRIICSKQT